MKLLFIYNADSGKLNALFDIAHKALSPATYRCDLCSLTHDTFAEKARWKRFREETDLDLEILHKDEFERRASDGSFDYPVILKADDDGLSLFMSRDEIARLADVDALIRAIEERTK